MWILNFVPNWIFHIALIAGVIGLIVSLFVSVIPFVNRFKLPIQALSILVLVLSVWFEGCIYNEKVWLDRIAELEKKVAVAEEKAKEENVRIETKVVERVKVVKNNVEVIRREVEVRKEAINEGCVLSDTAIEMYNRAVKNE